MQCPIDKTEMKKGFYDQGMWIGIGYRSRFAQMWSSFVSAIKVFAYRCPKCGKVELTTQVEK